jgi:hypothetical protein
MKGGVLLSTVYPMGIFRFPNLVLSLSKDQFGNQKIPLSTAGIVEEHSLEFSIKVAGRKVDCHHDRNSYYDCSIRNFSLIKLV